MSDQDRRVPGISIVCVFNDLEMRKDCLDRSIAAYTGDVDVDYIPVDNRQHEFTSAGAALNHGAARARHDVVVFVHQDVYLHSIDRIATIGTQLGDEQWGLLGANGVAHDGRSYGLMRDRVLLIGTEAEFPVEVDSVDEVLFLIRRERVISHPLSTDPDLAWHAYAVEYGMRMRAIGLKVGAVSLAITHNSRTVNLDKLEEAHLSVGARYAEYLPIRTTCGTIGARAGSWRDMPAIRRHRWRVRWLLESLQTYRAYRSLRIPALLIDIRTYADSLVIPPEAALRVLNFEADGHFANVSRTQLSLTKHGTHFIFDVITSLDEIVSVAAERRSGESVLLTGLSMAELSLLAAQIEDTSQWVLGIQHDAIWVLCDRSMARLPINLRNQRCIPAGRKREWAHEMKSRLTLGR